MDLFVGTRVRKPIRKAFLVLGGVLVALLLFTVRCTSNADTGPRPQLPAPVSTTSPTSEATDEGNTHTTEPSAAPPTTEPEATPSASNFINEPGKIVAKFEDGPQGPYFILAPLGEKQSDLEVAWSQRGSLEASAKVTPEGEPLDVTAIPIPKAWWVNVSSDDFASYDLYAVYTSDKDTVPSPTDR
ncbi:hypothetical protein GWI34_20900 [Actinomadura sp. DSM 109109]|nr:hypothetical protein [Actinomadura lepetitiana]